MNISYNWLIDLIAIDLSAEQLAEQLTRVGLAVEGAHPHGDDFVFDVDLTSNRPDCLSHLGVAREIGAISGKFLNAGEQRRGEKSQLPYPPILAPDVVKIEDSELCHRFTARIIRNVKIGPSPDGLVNRLEAIGERSINNVADITNYVMHDLGQPMHAFDLDKLAENRIVVRRAKRGETITTLDAVERKLDETMLAICDAEKPVAIAGVMGGFDSGITDKTVNVLLEVASFSRENIRATSRYLNLATEASYRFERGVDIENLVRASDRAAELICDLTGGVASEFVDVYPTKFTANEIECADIAASVQRLTGLAVDDSECVRILAALGISSKKASDAPDFTSPIFLSPSWRHDLAIEEDLVEEIARHTGYEKIESRLPPAFGAGEYQTNESREKMLRQALVNQGFDEALSYSFIDIKFDNIFEAVPGVVDESTDEKFITLQDSVIDGAVRMRPSLLSGLLDAVRLNFNHKRRDLKLFEIGKVFAAKSGVDNLPNEQKSLALVITGSEIYENRAMPAGQLDFYDAKGAVETALDAAGVNDFHFTSAEVKHLRSGQSASISSNGNIIGFAGRLSDEIVENYKFKQPIYVAELNLTSAMNVPVKAVTYRLPAKFPSVVRDVSFIVNRRRSYADILSAVAEQDIRLCTNVLFVDIYEGKGVAEDERSITVRLEYRSPDRTLTEGEVELLHKQIVSQTERKLGIKTRS